MNREPMLEKEDEPLTYRECAVILKTSAKQVSRLPIKRIKMGHRTVRIMRSDLMAYLREHAA